jgi:hypothetical protein
MGFAGEERKAVETACHAPVPVVIDVKAGVNGISRRPLITRGSLRRRSTVAISLES